MARTGTPTAKEPLPRIERDSHNRNKLCYLGRRRLRAMKRQGATLAWKATTISSWIRLAAV